MDDSWLLRISNERALVKAATKSLRRAMALEGLPLAIENTPDLVVLDMMIPKLPGQKYCAPCARILRPAQFR